MPFVAPDTAQTIRIPVEDFNEFLGRFELKRERGNRHMRYLRANWSHETCSDTGALEVLLTLDLVEARHLQQHFGEQDGEALRAISRAFGIPPHNWNAYGYHPGCAGLSAAHNREHTSY